MIPDFMTLLYQKKVAVCSLQFAAKGANGNWQLAIGPKATVCTQGEFYAIPAAFTPNLILRGKPDCTVSIKRSLPTFCKTNS
jgi:hypothetical protein